MHNNIMLTAKQLVCRNTNSMEVKAVASSTGEKINSAWPDPWMLINQCKLKGCLTVNHDKAYQLYLDNDTTIT